MTQLLLRSRSNTQAGLVVASAGTSALVGEPMDPGSAAAMRDLGIDPGRHRARQFAPAMAQQADLVLTAERSHVDTILAQAPTALRRTFTIKEFARLARHLDSAAPRDAVAQAAAIRGLAPRPVDPDADDVADPHLKGPVVNRATAGELGEAVRAIIDALGLAPVRRRRPLPYPR